MSFCRFTLLSLLVLLFSSSALASDLSSLDSSARFLAMDWTYDLQSEKVIFKNTQHKLIFCPGMALATLDGKVVRLPETVNYVAGELKISQRALLKVKQVMTGSSNKKLPRSKRATLLAKAKKKEFKTIMIDAGHGGKDSGAQNKAKKLAEKDLNLSISLDLKVALEKLGFTVLMTRSTDVFLSLQQRSDLVNESSADFFISIHGNSAVNKTAKGFEIFYDVQKWSTPKKAKAAAKETDLTESKHGGVANVDEPTEELLYRMIIEENLRQSKLLANMILDKMSKKLDDKNRGLKSKNLHMVRETFVPSILVEVGFISHNKTATKLKTKYYRSKIVSSMRDAIVKFKKRYDLSNGFSN